MKFYKKHVITKYILDAKELDIATKIVRNYKCCGLNLHDIMVGFANGESYYDGGWEYYAK